VRNPFPWCSLLAATLGLVARQAAALPPLAELEARLSLAPESQMSEQAYQSARAAAEAGKAGLGWSVYGNLGLADNHDVIDAEHSRTYTQTQQGVGVSLPLLGSRLQLRGGIDEQQAQLARLDGGRELQHREALRRLRKAYADYWQAQRTHLLAEQYLTDAPAVEQALEQRTRAGLLLDSDRLDFESGFELARRDAASAAAVQAASLDILRLLTHADLDAGVAAPPLLADCTQAADADSSWMDFDPELSGLRHIVALRDDDPRDSALYPIQSSLQVGYQGKTELTTGRQGSSGAVSWTFQMPLDYGGERRLLSQAAAAELARARLELEVRGDELQLQRRELLTRRSALRAAVQFAAARLSAADAAVRERELRAGELAGDVIERLQQARLARYNAAKAEVEAEAALVDWYAEWARFDATTCEGAHRDAGGHGEADRSLYVWQAADWLAGAAALSGEVELARLRSAGVARLLISLNAGELERVRADLSDLTTAVRRSQQRGMKVVLLLGDPSWITDAHREELLGIVRALQSVPFDALHLDLEPEQLPAEAAPQAIEALAQTLQAVAAVSPWPLELSVHPRNLDASAAGQGLAAVLRTLHVAPTLMVYVADPERIVAIAGAALRAHPELRFRVAVSLERSAPAGQSLAELDDGARRAQLTQIEQRLQSVNFDGLALQLEDGWSLARAGG
jgi:hypothetical protein